MKASATYRAFHLTICFSLPTDIFNLLTPSPTVVCPEKAIGIAMSVSFTVGCRAAAFKVIQLRDRKTGERPKFPLG